MCRNNHHHNCIYTYPLDQKMASDPRMWRFDGFEGFQRISTDFYGQRIMDFLIDIEISLN